MQGVSNKQCLLTFFIFPEKESERHFCSCFGSYKKVCVFSLKKGMKGIFVDVLEVIKRCFS